MQIKLFDEREVLQNCIGYPSRAFVFLSCVFSKILNPEFCAGFTARSVPLEAIVL